MGLGTGILSMEAPWDASAYPEMSTLPRRWIVLGGGISGLLAAWRLRELGQDVEVWEAAPEAGGWARTLSWPSPAGEPGFLERGPQSLLMGRGDALELLIKELDLEVRHPGPRGPRWLGKGGRRHRRPTDLPGLLRAPGLGALEKLRILGEPFVPPAAREDPDLRAFFRRRMGEGFARELLPALVGGVLAAPPEAIGLDAAPHLRRLDQHGGLAMGALRLGPDRTRLPAGGTGALTRTLAERLGCVRTGRTAEALEPAPDGCWIVRSGGQSQCADRVVLALPAHGAQALLAPFAPGVAPEFAAIRQLDLKLWHSRHPRIPAWSRGFVLLLHPPEGRGLLGVLSLPFDDPRCPPGAMQLRAYLGGAYPIDPPLLEWGGLFQELRKWLPELPPPFQTRLERADGAFPLPGPEHAAQVARILDGLPAGLHWVGAARWGPALRNIAEGLRAWRPA